MKLNHPFLWSLLLTCIACISPLAHAQTYSIIHTFNGSDGAFPKAGVTLRGGSLFGTTTEGGAPYAFGNVYALTQFGDNWIPSSLYIFTTGQDGYDALSRPVFGPDAQLYGTFSFSPTEVFKLTPPVSICRTANCLWKLNVVHQFGQDLDVLGYGDLIFDQAGNMYGTASYSTQKPYDGGVYELSRDGNSWVETPIYYFQGQPDAAAPESGVIFDKNGNLFGSAAGGANGAGAIYRLNYVVGIGWTESVIYSLTNPDDGLPAGVTFDGAGNLFGVTAGAYQRNGGSIFELSPSGDTWTYKLLHTFPGGGSNCGDPGPHRPLTIDAAGNLYGTTSCLGSYQRGNVFKLTNTQNGWVYTSLYDFTGGVDGAYPYSQITIDANGNLYGTTSGGGSNQCGGGCGVVWKITP